jgi:hypothetical protein
MQADSQSTDSRAPVVLICEHPLGDAKCSNGPTGGPSDSSNEPQMVDRPHLFDQYNAAFIVKVDRYSKCCYIFTCIWKNSCNGCGRFAELTSPYAGAYGTVKYLLSGTPLALVSFGLAPL